MGGNDAKHSSVYLSGNQIKAMFPDRTPGCRGLALFFAKVFNFQAFQQLLDLLKRMKGHVGLNRPGTPGKGYYPDVVLTCEAPSGKVNLKRSACWIIEVLSESADSIDRGEKLHNYRAIPELGAYVLVSQNEKLVEVYNCLDDNSWRYHTLDSTHPKPLDLTCIDRALSLDEVYKGIQF
jgi:Uma2 family endonuclease